MENVKNMDNCKKRKLGLRRRKMYLNEDIIREMLSRLPIRDLFRAKCVCKNWLSITSSPDFINIHNRRNHDPSYGLLIASDDCEARELVFYYSSMHEHEQQGHCPRQFVPRLRFSYSQYQWKTQVVNGLVCLYSADRLTLLNICTRETLDLPPAPSHSPDHLRNAIRSFRLVHAVGSNSKGFTLGPHPPASATNCITTHYHLGFDTVHKVYKVLSLVHMGTKDCPHFDTALKCPCDVLMGQILTLSGPDVSSYKWREVRGAIPGDHQHHKLSFCVNGIWYWMYKHPQIVAHGLTSFISSLTHVVPECSYAPDVCGLLPEYHMGLRLMKFSQFRGRFALVDCSSSKESLHFYTHTLQWLPAWEKDTMNLPDALISPSDDDNITPVGNLPNGDVLLANVKADIESFTPVCSYNHETKGFRLFRVGKFPPLVASLSQSEIAVRIACVEENLTPLCHLLGTGDASR